MTKRILVIEDDPVVRELVVDPARDAERLDALRFGVRVLGRLPYGENQIPVKAFNFSEDVVDSHDKYLWAPASLARLPPQAPDCSSSAPTTFSTATGR